MDYSFRFGPGRQSRRLQQIERLRQLRARRSTSLAHDSADDPLSRGSTRGGKQVAKERKSDNTACVWSRDRKRRREPSGEVNQVVKQRSSPGRSFAATKLVTLQQQQQQEAPPPRLTKEVDRNVIECPIRGTDGRTKDARGDWSRHDPGLNVNVAKSCQPLGGVKGEGSRKRVDISTVPKGPLGSLDERRSPTAVSAFFSGGDSAVSTPPCSAQILPIRSGAALGRRRAGSSQRPIPLNENQCQQQQQYRKHKGHNSIAEVAATAAATVAAAESAGDNDADDRAYSTAGSNTDEIDGGLRAKNEDNIGNELHVDSSAESRPGHPALADTCGGIVLRLNPAERSLEPWGTTLAPLRAMCDIERSISRAGIEYRGVMHAVEGAQEMKIHYKTKVRTGLYSPDGKLCCGHERSTSRCLQISCTTLNPCV